MARSSAKPTDRTTVVFQDGVHLRDTPLWLDATAPRELCFVSSGLARRQSGGHERVLATPPTVRFCRDRLGIGDALIAPYNRPFNLGPLRLELLPAGSMLGAAQLKVQRGDERIVYGGRLGPLAGIESALRPQVRRCETLILATHRRTGRTSRARENARDRLLRRLAELREQERVAVVLCEPLGTAQELVSWCRRMRWRVRTHRTIAAFTQEYRRFGRDVGPSAELRRWPKEASGPVDADVVLWPTLLAHSPILRRIPRRKLLVASDGPALPAGLGSLADEVEHVPHLSCHATFDDLVAYARAARPERVVATGPHAHALATALRSVDAEVVLLGNPHQGELPF